VLVDPVVLSVAVPVTVWMLFRLWHRRQRWATSAIAATAVFVVIVSPWFIRNYRVFHALVPFRDNVGLELYVGNNGESWHFVPGGFHPSDAPREWAEFQELGEFKYMQHKKEQAVAFIAAHPGFFLRLSLRRALYMWTNFWSLSRRYLAAEPTDPFNILRCTTLTVLALAGVWQAYRDNPAGAIPFAIALFCFPLVYYVTHPEDYYRRPIDPIFVVLAVFAVARFWSKRFEKAESRMAAKASA
jgi:hypothetical protein